MPLSRLSIKQQLFLIVAIIALPAICIIINSGMQQRRAALQEARTETQKLAEAIVGEQKILVSSTRQLFIALSQLPEVTSRNVTDTQPILAEILRLSPQYSNIFIADASGAVWASAVPLQAAVNVADRRYFINALASGRLSSGEYHLARTSKKPTLNLGYPLKDPSGQVTAVLCVGLSLDYYRHIFDTYRLPKGASVALLDHQGTILTRAVEPEKFMGKPSNPEIFKYMQAGPDEETSIGASSVVGDERIQTYRKIRLEGEDTPYMYIRVGIPTTVVMADANRALARNLTGYSLALLFAFGLSWLIGKKFIIDRMAVLQHSSHRLADGDLTTRVAHSVTGGEIGALAQAFDDMAHKLAAREQALRASESNYRDIFNATHDALFVNDASGRFIEANQAAERMFGYARAQLLQLSVQDLVAGQAPYSIVEALQLIEKAFQEGPQNFEWLSRRSTGELFWCEIVLTPTSLVDEPRVLAVIRDISERKQMEQMKEAMLSSLSHEMRTPLTAMLGFLEFVTDNQVDAAQLKDYHVIMHKEALRLNEMITNFLDMQRLKARLHDYRFTPLAVRPLLDEVVAIYASPSARHTLTVTAPVDLPRIAGDDELLHQALGNLLSNAIKYSPDGGEVRLDARCDGPQVILAISDQGIGVPPDEQERIFELFYRVEASKRQITGTGLGLALVKEITVAHNGRVWVESRVGQGSTFYLALPVAEGV